VELRGASHLWGKDTYETEDALKDEVGDRRAQVICIGPAGENLVRYANIANDKGDFAGRTGMGAVMGSKKLKAVVARGKKKFTTPDKGRYDEIRKEMTEIASFSMVAQALHTYGSNVHMEYGMAIGDTPVKNWREARWDEGVENLAGVAVTERIQTRSHACYGCPVACKRVVEIKSGSYAMEEGPGPEYESAASLGTLLRMGEMEAMAKATELANRYGMDTISAGSSIAYAIEAYEGGLLTEEDTGGIRLSWNQPENLLELVDKIAHREGFGDVLADGTRIMSQRYGGEDFAIHVKGMECPMHDPRGLWSLALTYATSIRGACHCADNNFYIDMGLLSNRDLGAKRTKARNARGMAAQTIAGQTKANLGNSAVICFYVWNSLNGGRMEEITEMINAVTGFGYSERELAKAGERIWYLKRAIGNLCGATREDDRVPQRLLEPHPEGLSSELVKVMRPIYATMLPLGLQRSEKVLKINSKLTYGLLFPYLYKLLKASLYVLPGLWARQKRLEAGDAEEIMRRHVDFDYMIEDYYKLRDIDEQGRPSRGRLEELGLQNVADELHG